MGSRENKSYFDKSKFVTELKPGDFDPKKSFKLVNHKCSVVLFYAPWCPYCKAMKSKWVELGEMAAFFDVCSLNCEKYKAHYDKIKFDLPELVGGFPTMIVYKNGVPSEKVGEGENEREVKHLLETCMRSCKE